MTFAAISLTAGVLAGLALRVAWAAAAEGGTLGAAAALAALAVVLAGTGIAGRSLLAAALGVTTSAADWLVLVAGIAAGAALAGLLARRNRPARQRPAGLALLLVAALAIVPAYAATATGVAFGPCTGFDDGGTALTAEARGAFPVTLRWRSAGGCPPVLVTIVGVGSPGVSQGDRYVRSIGVGGRSGEIIDPGPTGLDALRAATCSMRYSLVVEDAAGHRTTAETRAATCRPRLSIRQGSVRVGGE